MALKTRKKEPFTASAKNSVIQGDNIVFIKGGSVIIDDVWLQFNDLRLNVKALVDDFINQQARRIFNVKNGILNVIVTINKNSKLEVIPSISLNQKIEGNVKVFESLSGRLPLLLVTLHQNGSDNLSGIKSITSEDIEIYKGYGNFTLIGEKGITGPAGDTGFNGLDGSVGITGLVGCIGPQGITGLNGETGLLGVTGFEGDGGVFIPRFYHETDADPVADFLGVIIGTLEEGYSVQFTNTSVGYWTNLLWDFGDGDTSTDNNPIHAYVNDGVYTVTLYLYGICNDSKKIRFDYITVSGGEYFIQDVVDYLNPYGIWISTQNRSNSNIQNTDINIM